MMYAVSDLGMTLRTCRWLVKQGTNEYTWGENGPFCYSPARLSDIEIDQRSTDP